MTGMKGAQKVTEEEEAEEGGAGTDLAAEIAAVVRDSNEKVTEEEEAEEDAGTDLAAEIAAVVRDSNSTFMSQYICIYAHIRSIFFPMFAAVLSLRY